jgi:hypothetical protein
MELQECVSDSVGALNFFQGCAAFQRVAFISDGVLMASLEDINNCVVSLNKKEKKEK